MRSLSRRTCLAALSSLLLAGVAGCDDGGDFRPSSSTTELTQGLSPAAAIEPAVPGDAADAALADFSLKVLRGADDGERNALVSGLSVMHALAMAANGAAGQTLSQMEGVLGLTRDELNQALSAFVALLDTSGGDKPKSGLGQLRVADSVWVREGTEVLEGFLQKNVDAFDAEVYQAPFDSDTCEDINGWVREKTSGMIDGIIDRIDAAALLYLVNALAFDAEWDDPYDPEYNVSEGDFTAADGSRQTASFMKSTEYCYLELAGAIGFTRPYKDGRFSFCGLLPAAGETPEALLEKLDGASLAAAVQAPERTEVVAALPKFTFDFGAELSDVLAALGMADAFDSQRADFSEMAAVDKGLFIGRVIHKTHIEVDEKGTRAAAVTSVGVSGSSALAEPKVVRLDRPFVCAICEVESGVPVFVGIVRSVA